MQIFHIAGFSISFYTFFMGHILFWIFCGSWIDFEIFLHLVASTLCVVCSALALIIRIRVEERILLEYFGDTYKKYKKETKALFPLVY